MIGCEEYDLNEIQNLKGINHDIDLMRDTLIDNCGCSPERVISITNRPDSIGPPTGASILNLLFQKAIELENEKIENLFFYFSGHGYLSPQNEVCLIPQDARIYPIQHGVLTQEKIVIILKQFVNVRHIILFLDICQDEIIPKGPSTSSTINSEYFPKGTIIFYSCFPKEQSFMLPGGSGSVFTQCLVNALQPQSGCCNVIEIADFLKIKVPLLSNKYGLEQKPYTQLQDISLGKVVLVTSVDNDFESAYVSQKEMELVRTFSSKIDCTDRELCTQYGLAAKREVLFCCDLFSQFERGQNRKTNFKVLLESMATLIKSISLYKKKAAKKKKPIIAFLIKMNLVSLNFPNLELVKDKFMDDMQNQIHAMTEDMRTLDQHLSLSEKWHKELVLYLLAANLAVQDYTGDGKNVWILKEQISSLRRSIRIYNQTSTDITEYHNFLSHLVIHLNDAILKISYLFSKVNLPPLESNLEELHAEHLNDILEDVSSLRNEVKEFFKKC